LTLTPVAPRPDDVGARSVWKATLSGPGLDATVVCTEAGWQPPPTLPDFLAALDQDWQGWEGERIWQSSDAELRLMARHDKTNTVLVGVEIDDGAPPRWRCTGELELDPGVFRDLAANAIRLGASSHAD
jgi:hypothetical protein